VLFSVHRKNLEMFSEGFAGAEAISKSNAHELVKLTESSAVLDLLFQFMYRQRPPDLSEIPFKTMAGLAEAAEKYEVYYPAEVCKLRMREVISTEPFGVMCYAIRFNHLKLANDAARIAITKPSSRIFSAPFSNSHSSFLWLRYILKWQDVLAFAHTCMKTVKPHYRDDGSGQCDYWASAHSETSHRLGGDIKSLSDLEGVFGSTTKKAMLKCANCTSFLDRWRKLIKDGVNGVGDFMSSADTT
jgi:hypothetical protein